MYTVVDVDILLLGKEGAFSRITHCKKAGELIAFQTQQGYDILAIRDAISTCDCLRIAQKLAETGVGDMFRRRIQRPPAFCACVYIGIRVIAH